MIPRHVWGYRGRTRPRMSRLPVSRIFVHHSVTARTGDPYRDARTLESIGISRFGYLSYSVLVWVDPGSGRVVIMEGQGDRLGAHTGGFNSSSLGICVIGNFEVEACPDIVVRAVAQAIQECRARGWVTANPTIDPHRAVKSTACPGNNLYRRVPDVRRYYAGGPIPGDDDLSAKAEDQIDDIHQMLSGNPQLPFGLRSVLGAAQVDTTVVAKTSDGGRWVTDLLTARKKFPGAHPYLTFLTEKIGVRVVELTDDESTMLYRYVPEVETVAHEEIKL